MKSNKKKIVVFDIDDTLLHADPSIIKIYKHHQGHTQVLSTDEYALVPDEAKSEYDLSDFEDPIKVYDSIIKGTPLILNLKLMDTYINCGYEFAFLTARGCEDKVKEALLEMLRYRDSDGTLRRIHDVFNKDMSHAVGDSTILYDGDNICEKKSNILKELCSKYDRVVFVDDDIKNVNYAKSLNLDNLFVVKAF